MAYPEHDKMQAVATESQAIGEFLEWLQGQPDLALGIWRPYYCLRCEKPWRGDEYESERCAYCGVMLSKSEDRLMPSGMQITDLLARYFGIDPVAVEAEKRAMLASIRAAEPQGGAS